MPVTNLAQVSRMAHLSGAEVPRWLAERVGKAGDDAAEATRIGVEIAAELCAELLEAGAPGLHLYTLNRSGPASALWRLLDLGQVSPGERAPF
jgi:methylenetetrahydrofolate reductase (NADPH)